jgi:hypothetical protein
MEHLTLEGRLGINVEIDLCQQCRAFWFDPFENIHLTTASTLKLFGLIATQSAEAASPFPKSSYCPRCKARLILTHDRQRNTPFQYYRCDAGHGRFTSFIDFLREKDFIRPLSPQQILELRQNISMVHCSNCGAPIDLAKASVCDHCGSPVSMLDVKKMREMATDLQKPVPQDHVRASGLHETGQLPRDAEVGALLAALRANGGRNDSSAYNLVDLGLRGVAQWLLNLMDG